MSQDKALVFLSGIERLIAKAESVPELKNIADQAAAVALWAKRAGKGFETVFAVQEYRIEAEVRAGELLQEMAKNKQRDMGGKGPRKVGSRFVTQLKDLGLTKAQSSHWQQQASVPKAERKRWLAEAREKREEPSSFGLRRLVRAKKHAAKIEELESIGARKAKAAEGVFDVVVLDPPWPIEKVHRDVRMNQVKPLDYPTMTLEQIAAIEIPSAEACHLWLWTTHRFLPDSFGLLKGWGFDYCCAFVWHKNGGFQMVGLPQFNCEFALYARKGSPVFASTKGFLTCFEAPRGAHSEKPVTFYNMIRRVTAGRRLDMFNRRAIEGFETWGKEAQ